jgi:hypothetical protein
MIRFEHASSALVPVDDCMLLATFHQGDRSNHHRWSSRSRTTTTVSLQPSLLLGESCRLNAIVCAQFLDGRGKVIAHSSF